MRASSSGELDAGRGRVLLHPPAGVPGMGTPRRGRASHASASCAGVTPFSAASAPHPVDEREVALEVLALEAGQLRR